MADIFSTNEAHVTDHDSFLEPVHHQKIIELYARYCQAADTDQGEAWAECFTGNGELYADGVLLSRGREEHIARRASASLMGNRQHWNNNIVLTKVSSDRVIGTAYLMVIDIDQSNATPAITMVGTYRDDIVLVENAWKFQCRKLSFLCNLYK